MKTEGHGIQISIRSLPGVSPKLVTGLLQFVVKGLRSRYQIDIKKLRGKRYHKESDSKTQTEFSYVSGVNNEGKLFMP